MYYTIHVFVWKNTEIVRKMNFNHLIIRVYSGVERRRNLIQLQMDTVSFVPAGTSPMQELCSEVVVGVSLLARFRALMDTNENCIVCGV